MYVLWERTLDLVFPPRCAGCGARGHLLCPICVATIPYLTPPVCPTCSRNVARPGVCPICRAYPPAFDRLIVAARFAEPVRECIHALKYEGQRRYAPILAEIARPAFASLPMIDALVPVPLHPARQRERGFNQATLIAQSLAPVSVPVEPNWLIRTRDTPPQVGKDRDERDANVADAFACSDPALVRGRRIALIDDVATTGATLNACARALRSVGARSIHAIAIARAQ